MNLTHFNRIIILLGVLLVGVARGQEKRELDVIKNHWLLYSDASNSLYHHLIADAFTKLDTRLTNIAQLKQVDDWKVYQEHIKQTLWSMAGSFPEKTNLNAKVVSRVKKEGYHIENIIYESLPSFFVTASLFIPDHIQKPAPAILFCSGHSSGVYRIELYQRPLLNLVKKGFIVLAIDPIGQGERLQYFDPAKGESIVGSSTKEHSYPSAQVFLIGKSIARYFIWDGIRGIDYLVGRKEVDPHRIGVHGLSGGGTQAAYISALDDRVAASAPAGYITSYRRLLESVGVQDGEQNFYQGLTNQIDHADFIEARAPKPTLIMATTRDFFSIQGARETFTELQGVYRLFGKPDNIEIVEDDYVHGYTKKTREAMYAFFQKHLQLPGSPAEEEVTLVPSTELQKTPTGQLSNSIGGETVFSLNQKEAGKLVDRLNAFRENNPSKLSGILESAKSLSGYREPGNVQNAVFTGRSQRDGYVVEKYFVKGEGEYVIPYLLLVPDNPNHKAVLYIHPDGKLAEALEGGEMEWFAKRGFVVLAPDLIGVGETGPGLLKGDAYIDGASYNMWYTSILIGKSIAGIRAGDVSRLTQLLERRSDVNEIYGVAKKEMASVLLHAAAFNPLIKRVALIDGYSSYRSIVMNRFYNPEFVQNLVAGALTAYDLPDLAACLAPRELMLVGTTDGNSEREDQEGMDSDFEVIKTAYGLKNAGKQLKIVSESSQQLEVLFGGWLSN